MPAATVSSAARIAPKMPMPPACHAAVTGGTDTSIAARPPSAANPIVPTLNRPAYPHWILTPSAMIAEMMHMFRSVSDTSQLWTKPTMAKRNAITANSERFLAKALIAIFH